MIQVNINGISFSYEPDYHKKNGAWKIKNADAFTFVEIGGAACFVKRFEHPPMGHLLLLKWKGTQIPGFPRIWDYIETTEKGKIVFYLFLERLEGATLREEIEKSSFIRLEYLLNDILNGISRLHEDGFWFTDFNEENIFLTANGRFFLIDIDSCTSLDVLPNSDQRREGGLPGAAQQSASVAAELFKYHKSDFSFQHLGGKELNLLQVLVMLAQLRKQLQSDHRGRKDEKYFRHIADIIECKNQILIRSICTDALGKEIKLAEIREMAEFIIGFRALSPIIKQFDLHNNIVKWQTIGAESVNLRIGAKKYNVPTTGDKEITASQAVECTLTVAGQYGTPEAQTLSWEPLPVPAPKPFFWGFFY
jgi:hypothetical protein